MSDRKPEEPPIKRRKTDSFVEQLHQERNNAGTLPIEIVGNNQFIPVDQELSLDEIDIEPFPEENMENSNQTHVEQLEASRQNGQQQERSK